MSDLSHKKQQYILRTYRLPQKNIGYFNTDSSLPHTLIGQLRISCPFIFDRELPRNHAGQLHISCPFIFDRELPRNHAGQLHISPLPRIAI